MLSNEDRGLIKILRVVFIMLKDKWLNFGEKKNWTVAM